MTIVVAGYNYGQNLWRDLDKIKDPASVKQEGLFAIADSIITSHSSNGHTPLLSGFKKIKEVPVKLWQPYFIGENFQGYKSVFLQFECFVAFAGSTLTAQHVIDSISNHLANLRIDYQRKCRVSPPEYVVKKSCEKNTLESNGSRSLYGDDMFVPEIHYRGLLTADYICDVVEHSINTALKSAQKYKIDPQSLKEMYTEFILGVNCPSEGADRLVKFTMDKRINLEGMYEVFVKSDVVPPGSVAVIGMNQRFGKAAQNVATTAISNGKSLKNEMISFVKESIDEVNNEGSFQIAMPMVLKTLEYRRINKIVIPEEA